VFIGSILFGILERINGFLEFVLFSIDSGLFNVGFEKSGVDVKGLFNEL
jgi:hypothetical protein